MVLEGNQIVQVVAGQKTQARRPVVLPQRARRARALAAKGLTVTDVARQLGCTRGHVYALLNAPVATPQAPYRPGESVKVMRRTNRGGQHEVCRVKVGAVWQQPLGEVTDAQARAEGFKGQAPFLEWWHERYGTDGRDVWVVEFALDPGHRPRLLAGRHGDQHGYTESSFNAMRDEPEAVPELWQAGAARAAFERDHAIRMGRAEQLLRERSRKRRAA